MPDKTTFTKEEVSMLMKKRVERSHQSFFKRYGVKDLSELDALFDKANSLETVQGKLDALQQQHDELVTNHKDLTKRYAFSTKRINPDKIADIEAYYKGKGLEIDEASLDAELQAHPDWVTPDTGIQPIGSETVDEPDPDAQELAYASQLFGVDLSQ